MGLSLPAKQTVGSASCYLWIFQELMEAQGHLLSRPCDPSTLAPGTPASQPVFLAVTLLWTPHDSGCSVLPLSERLHAEEGDVQES